jgi:hypothetical protein
MATVQLSADYTVEITPRTFAEYWRGELRRVRSYADGDRVVAGEYVTMVLVGPRVVRWYVFRPGRIEEYHAPGRQVRTIVVPQEEGRP